MLKENDRNEKIELLSYLTKNRLNIKDIKYLCSDRFFKQCQYYLSTQIFRPCSIPELKAFLKLGCSNISLCISAVNCKVYSPFFKTRKGS